MRLTTTWLTSDASQMYNEAAACALSPSTQEAASAEAAEAAAEDADLASAGSGTPRAKTPAVGGVWRQPEPAPAQDAEGAQIAPRYLHSDCVGSCRG